MTTTDPIHAEGHVDAPQHADTEDTFLDYAAREYTDLAAQTARMPMDVHIAATIGLGYEVRRLTDAIERLEQLLADPTAVLHARQAEEAAHRQGDLFALEQAEAAVEPLPAAEGSG